jgi:DNA-directed RNA polymerase subunit RPC12/RpoP
MSAPTEVVKWSQHCFRLRSLVFVAIVVLSTSLINRPLSGQPVTAEINETFRGGRSPSDAFAVVGAIPGIVTGPEVKGFRITVPAQGQQTDRVGLELATRLKGDFEITIGYELQKAGPPIDGHGVGVELFIDLDTPTRENLGLMRVSRVNESEVYLFDHEVMEDGKPKYNISTSSPTTARSGRLRISRVGTTAICEAAEGEAGKFEEVVDRREISSAEVKTVRAAVFLGNTPNAADVFITEVRVRPLTAREASTLTVTPNESRPEGSGWWLAVTLLFSALILGLLIALGVWLTYRSKSRPPVGTADGQYVEAPTARPVVSFNCSTCGKSLRAFATLSGKKVKCSQCGVPVLVPETV